MCATSHTLGYVGAVATPRAAAARATRERLLDAAIERFAAEGTRASFSAVAADAGATKGALYHHFAAKDGLVEAVYREVANRHAERILEATRDGSGRVRLFALVDESARRYSSGTPFYALLISLHVEAQTTRPHLAPIASRLMLAQRTYMRDLVAAGQADGSIRTDLDAEAVGTTVNSALMGLFLTQHHEAAPEQRRLVAQFRSLLEALL